MMKTRHIGTFCSGKDTGGMMRRGMIALAALLLVCTLMAGTVSADDQTLTSNSEFNFTNGEFATIGSGGWYKLNASGAGNISITASSGNVILNSTEGVTLTGNITISGLANVTIDGMNITVNSSTLDDDNRVSAIRVTASNPGCFVLKNSVITFDNSVNGRKGYVFLSSNPIGDGSQFSDNTITNVPGHALNLRGVVDGGTVTVNGNTVTMNPDEDIGMGSDPQGTGRALLKVWHGSLTTGVTYIVKDNVVSNVPNNNNKTNVVRVDTPTDSDMVTVKMTNNKLNGDAGSSYLYGGSVPAKELKELRVNLTENIVVLTPGLNQTGVAWTPSGASWTLAITEAGNYKLWKDFTTTGDGIRITANDVTLDGNDKTITAQNSINQEYIVLLQANNLKVQNLKVDESQVQNSTSNKPKSIDVFYLGSTASGSSYSNINLTNNEILAGTSKEHRSTGIVIAANDVTLDGNTIHLGKSERDDTSKQRNESIGIRLWQNPTGLKILNNTLISQSGVSNPQVGILFDAVGNQGKVIISNNTFNLGTTGVTGAVLATMDAGTGDKTLEIEFTDNTITSAKQWLYLVPDEPKESNSHKLTLEGDIYNNNFANLVSSFIGNDSIVSYAEGSTLKWNTTPAAIGTHKKIVSDQKYLAGNWWGTWSEGRKSPNGYLMLTEKDPGLPVADLAPLVSVGTPSPSPGPAPGPLSSGDGNMNNAFRVLFDTSGGSLISPVTYLSYGDTISQPPAPTKDGYTFGGWYKDEECTQAWRFADSISGDMTLYAKWTSTAVGQSAGSPQPTSGSPAAAVPAATQAAPQTTQSQSSGTAAPAATNAAGASPTLTQAPAPIAGLLFGLLAAGILLRRRD